MNIEQLSSPSAENLEIYVDSQEHEHRLTICSSCEFYSPGGYLPREITDAITGEPSQIIVFVYEDCSIDNTAVNAFTSLKISVCPKEKW